jgi:hypothetical protein
MRVFLSWTLFLLPAQVTDAADPSDLPEALDSCVATAKGEVLSSLFLRKGMPKEEVLTTLGAPTIKYSACGHTTYIYCDYHLQLWFEKDCPRRSVIWLWQGKEESSVVWAGNPTLPRYKDRLVRVEYCPF